MTEIDDKVDLFMRKEMPQIEMHGGGWDINSFKDGVIEIELHDACSGCGISPMTIQALKKRMPDTIDEVTGVEASTVDKMSVTDGPF